MSQFIFSPEAVHYSLTVNAVEKKDTVLEDTLAGSWYEASPDRLHKQIRNWMEQASLPSEVLDVSPIALIQPHAGYIYSAPTAAYGLRVIAGRKYDRVFILGPSHHVYLRNGLCIPEAAQIRTPFGDLPVDQEVMSQLKNLPFVRCCDPIHREEHSIRIQCPLLQAVLKEGFRIVPIIVGQLDNTGVRRIAAQLKPFLTPQTLVVISSDFTHFGRAFNYVPFRENYAENLKKLDLDAFGLIHPGNAEAFASSLERTGATICGEAPLRILMELLPPQSAVSLLHYTTSSAKSGDYSHCVSYVSGMVSGKWLQPKPAAQDFLSTQDKITLLKIARDSIAYVFQNRRAAPDRFFEDRSNDNLRKKMGCFVTLNKNHDLRGCIGEIEGYRPLYQGVTGRAVDAAFRDPRFPQLEKREFKEIEIEISVLTPSCPVKSWKEIVIGKHGMTLTLHGRSAVFLPQVAPEQGWTLEETLSYLSRKAGLPEDAWQSPECRFTVFEAIVFRESDFGLGSD